MQTPQDIVFPSLGIDLVDVDRIARLIKNERFTKRIFTDMELEYCRKRAFPERSLAARFAVKEATAKALGTGIGERLGWKDVELVSKAGSKPRVRLNGRWIKRPLNISVSIAHTKTTAAAVVMIFPKET